MKSLSGTILKGYELDERIGSGGFGAVYRAHQTTVNREVAIKVILPGLANRPDFIRRFESEAQIVSHLEHPFIVPLFDYWRDPEGAYLVMRYLRGGNLSTAIGQSAFDVDSAARLLEQVTSALSTAHRNKVIHRDIKPGNILLDEDGNAYVSDFGIAKDLKKTSANVTEPDQLVGSPDYLAPEQARGEAVTPQTDIYSLGVVLYELLVGEHPFPNLTGVERIFKHLGDPLPLIENLDPTIQDAINDVIQKATQKNPTHRYADVLGFMVAFRQAIAARQESSESDVVELLTLREQEVLQCMIEGLDNQQIAEKLFIAVSTVKWYIRQIYKKLGVRSRVQAIVRARELDLVVQDQNPDQLTVIGGSTTASLLTELENPYKGLRAFQPADEQDFFGREKLTQRLVERFGDKGPSARFLAIVGPSGSGKTSLVKAGLIPALWRGDIPGSEKWFVVEMLPGSRPLDELEIALTRVAADYSGNLREQLQRDKNGLLRVAQLILPQDGSDLVLIVDQFEEIFTLLEDEQERMTFLALLYAAVTEKRSRVRVVITMRADFYDRPLMYSDFGKLVQERTHMVLPLTAEELERSIVGPAKRIGVEFEEGLIATIISEIHYQPGALPLLQYALTELFENREARTLTHAAYEQIGRAIGALANRAEEIYRELNDDSREITRQMFLRLVAVGDDTKSTRRRTPREEFDAITGDQSLLNEIIDTFAEYRLLSLDHDPATRTPTVEVAHEALLGEWERLRIWITESLTDVRFERLLATAAHEWVQNERKPGYLLHGARLVKFEGWARDTDIVLTELEREYLGASVEERTRIAVVEQERQARELALKDRAQRFLVALAAVLLLAAIASAGLAAVAFHERDSARREAAVNLSLVQSGSAGREFERGQTDLALALALEAVSIDHPPAQVEQTLREIAAQAGTRAVLVGHTYGVYDADFSADGHMVVSAGCAAVDTREVCTQGELILWDVDDGTLISRFEGHTGKINAVAFTPTGTQFLSGSDDQTLILWDIESGDVVQRFEGHTGSVNTIDFSSDGTRFLSGSSDQSIVLWDVETGSVLQRFEGHTGGVNSVEFSPDGTQFLSGADDQTMLLWDVETGDVIQRFEEHTDRVLAVAFHPDSRRVFSASADVFVYAWDVESGAILQRQQYAASVNDIAIDPRGQTALIATRRVVNLFSVPNWENTYDLFDHIDTVLTVAFSPDGRMALSGSADGRLRIWDLYPQSDFRLLASAGMPLWRIALSHDEQHALTGTWAGQAILWDVATGTEIRRFGENENLVAALDFSPDDDYILIGAANQTSGMNANNLALWDVQAGSEVQQFEGHNGGVIGGMFDLAGDRILSTSQSGAMGGQGSGELILWDAQTGQILQRVEDGAGLGDLALSPDGRFAVTGSYQQATFSLWDITNGTLVRRFEGHTDLVSDVAFSPDGVTILSASLDGNLILWNAATGDIIRQFAGHIGPVWGVDISSDGLLAASASQDGNVILWNLQTGKELHRFTGHLGSVSDVVFSHDGGTLYSSSFDGSIIEWQISNQPLDDLIDWIRANRYTRDFTCTERVQYRIQPLCG